MALAPTSKPPSQTPRFLPSEFLARLIWDAAAEVGPPESEPCSPGVPSLLVTPSKGIPGPGEEKILYVRESIGVRVERALATVAFRYAHGGRSEVFISESGQFIPEVRAQLANALTLPPARAEKVLPPLHRELQEAAAAQLVSGAWGRLAGDVRGLKLLLSQVGRDPDSGDRPRARVIG
jgi:hypothetical protein